MNIEEIESEHLSTRIEFHILINRGNLNDRSNTGRKHKLGLEYIRADAQRGSDRKNEEEGVYVFGRSVVSRIN